MARPSEQALVASPSNPQAVSTEGFDPSRWLNTLATDLLDKFLSPSTGVTRGLLSADEPKKIIGIRVDELRQIALCLRVLKREREMLASAIEARSDATGTGAAEGESAVPNGETPNG